MNDEFIESITTRYGQKAGLVAMSWLQALEAQVVIDGLRISKAAANSLKEILKQNMSAICCLADIKADTFQTIVDESKALRQTAVH